MSDKSAIEWTEATWNPVTGCTKVSPGCAYCYAERLSLRFGWSQAPWIPANAAQNIVLHPERLEQPFRWSAPRRVFVNSMSDLFHETIPDDYIDRIFAVMALTPRHTYQVLTKRPERMREYVTRGETEDCVYQTAWEQRPGGVGARRNPPNHWFDWRWPLPNVWLGVTVENQHWADERIPPLLETPAAVRFISAEPLLGPIDIAGYLGNEVEMIETMREELGVPVITRHSILEGITWVIAGGESGGPPSRRLVIDAGVHYKSLRSLPAEVETGRIIPKTEALAWVRSLRDQCVQASVPYFFKQWGGPQPTSGGRLLDGREWSEYPNDAGQDRRS